MPPDLVRVVVTAVVVVVEVMMTVTMEIRRAMDERNSLKVLDTHTHTHTHTI